MGLTGGSLGSRHGETVQMYIVAIMIELKSTFSCLLGYHLFNYLSLCPQLSCMHYNINPTLLIQGIANDNANVTCSFLTEVGATNSRILQPLAAPCIMLLRWLVVTLFCVILLESVLRYSALFYVILLCTSLCQTMLFYVIPLESVLRYSMLFYITLVVG